MVHGLRHRLPHQAGRAERAVQPGRGDHPDDRAHPAPLLADPARHVPSNSTSAEAFRTVAQLVLQPLDQKALRLPSGRTRGTRKQVRLAGGVREHQERVRHGCRAEPLVPGQHVRAGLRRAVPPWCSRGRRCRPASRSCPSRTARLASAPRAAAAGRRPWTSAGAPTRRPVPIGAQRGTAACVIDSGQQVPASTCVQTRKPAARRTCPEGRVHAPVSPPETLLPSSRCQAGWNSTSSIRWPYRSWLRSRGGCSFACTAHSLQLGRAGGPAERRQLGAHLVQDVRAGASGRRPSARARSAVKTS